mmetsp:Transcript_21771/g.34952  ORF Transcript_21771/g.34952 Transcript_21771/m.34952 type:complete len:216 (-) Transcript_21771:580-1227(-)
MAVPRFISTMASILGRFFFLTTAAAAAAFTAAPFTPRLSVVDAGVAFFFDFCNLLVVSGTISLCALFSRRASLAEPACCSSSRSNRFVNEPDTVAPSAPLPFFFFGTLSPLPRGGAINPAAAVALELELCLFFCLSDCAFLGDKFASLCTPSPLPSSSSNRMSCVATDICIGACDCDCLWSSSKRPANKSSVWWLWLLLVVVVVLVVLFLVAVCV